MCDIYVHMCVIYICVCVCMCVLIKILASVSNSYLLVEIFPFLFVCRTLSKYNYSVIKFVFFFTSSADSSKK